VRSRARGATYPAALMSTGPWASIRFAGPPMRDGPAVRSISTGGTVSRQSPDAKNGDGHEHWVLGIVAGLVALAALVAGAEFGNLHGSVNAKLVAWISAAVLLIAGVWAVTRISRSVSQVVARRSPPTAGPVRVLTAVVGYLLVLLAVLSALEASISHLLLGVGLVGVVLGIAAQQSLGNVFAGLVLLLARPFGIGDRIKVRSGALGGVFDASVLELSLTYVTLATEDGVLKVPNSQMLAAGIIKLSSAAGARGSGAPDQIMPE
jgi:small-conductance mechanosensitive channel